MPTHEVTNQAVPLVDYDVFNADRALCEAVDREGAGWARERLTVVGKLAGGPALDWGEKANRNPPILKTHDRFGHRVDEVEFHPAWHELMRAGIAHELHALPWRDPRPGANVARAALFMTLTQAEAGFGCPISMTYSVVPALRAQPELAREWEPRFLSTEYDPRMRPAADKAGAICGMAMTEKQGGSDVRANTTRAVPLGKGGPGGEYAITGHKWFCSAPQSDAFLMLAYSERGLSCFLLPRWLPDGTRNKFYIQRLKDKMGNKSNASSEVEFDGAWARMVGEEGRGVPTIIEMVGHTRLDCCIGAAAGIRQATVQALHHAHYRSVFGKKLVEQPLMQNVLADLALESEAATATMARLARAYDESEKDENARRLARLATAVCKYWLCKRAPMHAAEALECLGGNGFVEESMMPRLYREAPLNGVWEGSGNVICLDVLRAMSKDPESVGLFFGEIAAARDPRLDAHAVEIQRELADRAEMEMRARRIVERMAILWQSSLMLRCAPSFVAEPFVASRLVGDHGIAFGTLPRGTQLERIIERASV